MARKCLFCPDQIKLEEIISHGTQPRVNLTPCLSVKVDKRLKSSSVCFRNSLKVNIMK